MGPGNQRPGATLQTDPTTLPGGTEVRDLVHPMPGRTCVRGPFGPSTNEASRPIRHRTRELRLYVLTASRLLTDLLATVARPAAPSLNPDP